MFDGLLANLNVLVSFPAMVIINLFCPNSRFTTTTLTLSVRTASPVSTRHTHTGRRSGEREEIFRSRLDRLWAHPSSITMATGSFPGVKRPGRGVDHPPPSGAEVKERVELYLYSPLGLRGLFEDEFYLYLYKQYLSAADGAISSATMNRVGYSGAKIYYTCLINLKKYASKCLVGCIRIN